jgi:predicted NBD/HSP70 family sugar kinase
MKLGLDLTDAMVRAVVVNDGGQVVARAEHLTAAGGLGPAVRESARRARAAAGKEIHTVGMAMLAPGDAPPGDATAAAADALPGLTPVAVASGTATAIAETWCGAARGLRNVVTFAIGEHVTAGLIVDGKVWTGAHGYAGSVGWLALNPVEREDYRRLGGLEAEVAAAGIVRRLVWRIKSGDRSGVVDQVGGDLGRLTADLVFQGARSGDGVCISVVRDTAKYVGMAVSNLATVLDPEAIVLGGTLAAAGDMMLEAIRVECGRRLSPPQSERVRIVLSTLGADAVAIGAARAAAPHPQ